MGRGRQVNVVVSARIGAIDPRPRAKLQAQTPTPSLGATPKPKPQAPPRGLWENETRGETRGTGLLRPALQRLYRRVPTYELAVPQRPRCAAPARRHGDRCGVAQPQAAARASRHGSRDLLFTRRGARSRAATSALSAARDTRQTTRRITTAWSATSSTRAAARVSLRSRTLRRNRRGNLPSSWASWPKRARALCKVLAWWAGFDDEGARAAPFSGEEAARICRRVRSSDTTRR